jgi:hypothetical protein
MEQPAAFLNDTSSGKSFRVVQESQMKVFHIGGEVGYTVGDKFSLISGLTFNQLLRLKIMTKPGD